ncbi:MAG: secondary thiamine-phosphate synthase enzyme YjbQ [Myxococcota bacterium]
MNVFQQTLEIGTRGRGFSNVTQKVAEIVEQSSIRRGICSVFVQHTSASLVIQENADPRVLTDLADFMADLVPESRDWEHDDEGPDDMPAHARSALTRTSETVPVVGGRLALGTWQALYLWEHRARPHRRTLVVTVVGD